ncbi:hypothetical protein L209DRAFT_271215 [Thermothelomyces heterothallicus CBS 203.75]
MNVSLQDGHNVGWKLGMVLRRLARPDALLPTYVLERERTAADLIDFDRAFARLFDSRYRRENHLSPREVADHFVRAGRYTAGQAVRYDPSVITAAAPSSSSVASGLTVGMAFRSAQVVRFCDAKAMQLVRGMPANGQWYLVVFAGDLARPESAARLREVSSLSSSCSLFSSCFFFPSSSSSSSFFSLISASKRASPTDIFFLFLFYRSPGRSSASPTASPRRGPTRTASSTGSWSSRPTGKRSSRTRSLHSSPP